MNADRTARLEKKIAGLARTRYIPETEAGESKQLASQLGGVAWLPRSSKWPRCKSCKRPMHLILQLTAADAPADALVVPKGKVCQVFHCGRTSSCDEMGYASTPDGHGKLVRLIDAKSAVRAADPPDHLALGRRIVGFASAPEVPGHGDVIDHMAAKLNAKELAAIRDSEQRPYGKTKLGGWADWIQDVQSDSCTKCDAKMRFVLQLADEVVEFGDGLAYVQQCPAHPEQFAMGWSMT
ncbi:MAG: DUF1963 domain-containing protein [Myxococcales bacterium]|nr:DUF1963 domain-containing protein [Myxococcales bacterium]